MAKNRLKRFIKETLVIKDYLLLTGFVFVVLIASVFLLKIKYEGWQSLVPLLVVSEIIAAPMWGALEDWREEKRGQSDR
jgi:hypothetical protein